MITPLDIGPNVLGYRVTGKIEKPDIESAVADWDRFVKANQKFSIFVDIEDLHGMTPQALARDLQLGIPRMGDLRHIDKMAVVSDSDVIRNIVGLQSHLASHWFQAKAFTRTEKQEAISWVTAPRDLA